MSMRDVYLGALDERPTSDVVTAAYGSDEDFKYSPKRAAALVKASQAAEAAAESPYKSPWFWGLVLAGAFGLNLAFRESPVSNPRRRRRARRRR